MICDPGDDVTISTNGRCINTGPVNPVFAGVDTTCVIFCDTIAGIEYCDTTLIISVVPPLTDEIVLVTVPNSVHNICLTLNELNLGFTYDTAYFCHNVSTTETVEEFLLGSDSCISVATAANPTNFLEKICLVTCHDVMADTVWDTTYIIIAMPPPVNTIKTIVRAGVTDTLCIDSVLQLGGGYESASICEDAANLNEDIIANNNGDSCLRIHPVNGFYGVDTTCLAYCYDFDGTILCDTTYVITIVPPETDTTVTPIAYSGQTEICLNTELEWGSGFANNTFCQTSPNLTTNFTNGGLCLQVEPAPGYVGVDTLCVYHCYDSIGMTMCDTTVLIIAVSPLNESKHIIIPYEGMTTVCVDTLLQWGSNADAVNICKDAVGLTETIVTQSSSQCLQISGASQFAGIDTTCIAHCYDTAGIQICDTTTIIVAVTPPNDAATFAVPPGETKTYCFDGVLQFGDHHGAPVLLDSTTNVSAEWIVMNGDSCLEISVPAGLLGLDTLVTEHCYVFDGQVICDTTTVVIVSQPIKDTMDVIISPNQFETVCVDPDLLQLGTGYNAAAKCADVPEITNFLSGSCLGIFVPLGHLGLVHTCIAHSYTIGGQTIWDTTIIRVITPPPMDAKFISMEAGSTRVECVENQLQLGGNYDFVEICNPSPHITATVVESNGDSCVQIIPDTCFTGSESFCVAHCYNLSGYILCDTTILNVNVTVEKIKPTAICKDTTVVLAEGTMDTITAQDLAGDSYDACGIASIASNDSIFSTADIGDNMVTLTVTDVNNNISTCISTVTVELENTCVDTLFIDSMPITEGEYTAIEAIIAEGQVAAPDSVVFKAGNCILLDAGFSVELGAEFETIMVPCMPPGSSSPENTPAQNKEVIVTEKHFNSDFK